MYCYECGKEIQLYWKYCVYCGEDLSGCPEYRFEWDKSMESSLQASKDLEEDFFIIDEDPEESGWEPETGEPEHRFVPTSENEDLCVVERVKTSKVRGDELEIQLRFNDTEYDVDPPEEYLYNRYNIYERDPEEYPEPLRDYSQKQDFLRNNVPVLSDVAGYLLDEDGIFYVMDGTLYRLTREGCSELRSGLENLLKMEWDEDGQIVLTIFDRMRQTAFNEHRDECGYMYEAWYDVYEIISHKETVQVN